MDVSSSNIITRVINITTLTAYTSIPNKQSEMDKATEDLKKENERIKEAIKQKEKEEAELLKKIKNVI